MKFCGKNETTGLFYIEDGKNSIDIIIEDYLSLCDVDFDNLKSVNYSSNDGCFNYEYNSEYITMWNDDSDVNVKINKKIFPNILSSFKDLYDL